jgi:predicted Rossmann fold flavoprotein
VGGYSHPETGSTGDGFKLLKDFGIKITEPVPSLVPVSVANDWVKKLSGKTIENIKLTFFIDGVKKKIIKNNLETKNRILFTHFGLSGPTILNNSKYISDWMHEGEVSLSIDLFPEMDEKVLDNYLLNIFDNNKNKIFKNILNDIYTGNILEDIFLDEKFCIENNFVKNEKSSNFLNTEVHSISKADRRKLVNIFKNLKINITGLMGYDKAIIADGGIDPNEINWENMSLKRYSNLRVTGDMINISRPSGGYSLQLCWTTGYVAGR